MKSTDMDIYQLCTLFNFDILANLTSKFLLKILGQNQQIWFSTTKWSDMSWHLKNMHVAKMIHGHRVMATGIAAVMEPEKNLQIGNNV